MWWTSVMLRCVDENPERIDKKRLINRLSRLTRIRHVRAIEIACLTFRVADALTALCQSVYNRVRNDWALARQHY